MLRPGGSLSQKKHRRQLLTFKMAGEKEGIKIKFCPQCGSEEVALEAGGVVGKWKCKRCGYVGVFPERELVDEEPEGMKKEKE